MKKISKGRNDGHVFDYSKIAEKIYLGCKDGHGRSPILAAAYFARYKGKGINGVVEFIKKKRPEIYIEENQRETLEEFKKKWSR